MTTTRRRARQVAESATVAVQQADEEKTSSSSEQGREATRRKKEASNVSYTTSSGSATPSPLSAHTEFEHHLQQRKLAHERARGRHGLQSHLTPTQAAAMPVTNALVACACGGYATSGGEHVGRKVHDVLRKLQSMESINSANSGELKAVGATVDASMTITRQVVSEEMSRARDDLNAIRSLSSDIQRHVRSIDERKCLYRQQVRQELQRIRQLVNLEAEATRRKIRNEIMTDLREIKAAASTGDISGQLSTLLEHLKRDATLRDEILQENAGMRVQLGEKLAMSDRRAGQIDATLSLLVTQVQSISQQMQSMSELLGESPDLASTNKFPLSSTTAGDGIKDIGVKENTVGASNVAGPRASKRRPAPEVAVSRKKPKHSNLPSTSLIANRSGSTSTPQQSSVASKNIVASGGEIEMPTPAQSPASIPSSPVAAHTIARSTSTKDTPQRRRKSLRWKLG